jgi:signal transduction histidine kinase
MRVAHSNNDLYLDKLDKRGRPYRRMSLAQRAQLRKHYIANVPRWRRPFVGYAIALPVVFACSLLSISVILTIGGLLFPAFVYVLAVLFAALFWGVGPAIFTVLLCSLSLEYFVLARHNHWQFGNWNFTFGGWDDLLQLLPFIVSGLIIAWITAQRERARLQSLAAEQELQLYAQDLEEINRQLEDASHVKDRFISIASHELKTPITTIRGQAQLLLRHISKRSQVDIEHITPVLKRINEQTGRLTSLIDELLDVSSMQAGKIELRVRKFDLRELCREVVEDQKSLTDHYIFLDVPATEVMMKADADRLSQVLTNLIGNAAKYSPERSQIDVTLTSEDGCARLLVKDRGYGIAKDQQEHIFETFYRAPDAQASSQRGLGLGLAITRDIVERHRGKIWVESEPGEGSSFFVELPGLGKHHMLLP